MKNKKECSVCGIVVERWPSQLKNSNSVVCSKKCLGVKMSQIYLANRVNFKCEECGNEFLLPKSVAKKDRSGRFCSVACKRKWFRGKNMVRRKQNNIIDKISHYEMIIQNNKGLFIVLFDKEDLNIINKYTWFMGNHGYACAHIHCSRKIILMHRLILNTPDGMDTDHRNHNTCDNRKNNLRICTTSQNMINIHIGEGRKYKGVYVSRHGRFYAKNANKYLGTFATPELAAQAYNNVVKYKYGDFAKLNKI